MLLGNSLSGDRFSVEYHLAGTELQAHGMAERLCADQTIEAPLSLLQSCQIPAGLLGRVEELSREEESCHRARISFPVELFGHSIHKACVVLIARALGVVRGALGCGQQRSTDGTPPQPRAGQHVSLVAVIN